MEVHERCIGSTLHTQFRRLPPRLGKPCKVRAQVSATKVDRSDVYNEKMKQAMGWQDADPYQYHYDRGLYYHEIIPNLLCGSQPRNVADVAELEAEVGVTTVINVGMHGCCKSSLRANGGFPAARGVTRLHYCTILHVHTQQGRMCQCSCSKMLIFSTGVSTLVLCNRGLKS